MTTVNVGLYPIVIELNARHNTSQQIQTWLRWSCDCGLFILRWEPSASIVRLVTQGRRDGSDPESGSRDDARMTQWALLVLSAARWRVSPDQPGSSPRLQLSPSKSGPCICYSAFWRMSTKKTAWCVFPLDGRVVFLIFSLGLFF